MNTRLVVDEPKGDLVHNLWFWSQPSKVTPFQKQKMSNHDESTRLDSVTGQAGASGDHSLLTDRHTGINAKGYVLMDGDDDDNEHTLKSLYFQFQTFHHYNVDYDDLRNHV